MKLKKLLSAAVALAMVTGAMAGCSQKTETAPAEQTESTEPTEKTEGEEASKTATDYPKKDITVIIPKAAGGGTDTSTRGLVQFMKNHLEGANFVPTNKPDGGGVTGMVETANAKADGYTLGMVTVELAMFPHQDKSPVTYENFAPICAPIAAPAALVVPKDAPYNSVDEFVAYCKENPGKVQVGNSGMGAIWHIAAVAFEKEFDVSLKHIPYPNGSADIAAAIAGGHIEATIADPSNFKSQVDAGTLKILGLMADERSNLYPDVPTFKELGHDMTIRAWAVLVAPKDTPADVVEALRAAAKETMEDQEYIDYFVKQGIDPVNIVGEDCYKMMEEDHKMYGEMLASIDLGE